MENRDYVNLSGWYAPPETPVAPEPPEPPHSPSHGRTWLTLLLAVGLSALYWEVFSIEKILPSPPGLGVLVFVLAYFVAVFVTVGPRWDAAGVFLMAVSVCLALCCTLYAHTGFTVLNCFIILVTAAMATFRLSGQAAADPLSIRSLPETFLLAVFALFTRLAPAFRALGRPRKRDANTRRIVWTVLGSLALLAVVLVLLATADMVFGSFFDGLSRWIDRLEPGIVTLHVCMTAILAPFLFSGLFYLRNVPARPQSEQPERERHALPFLLPVLLLDAVYILFCAVQIRYLFGGAQAASMAGGWAEYARTGFFQLVTVAAINLTLCAVGTHERRFAQKGGPVLRIADGLLLVLTVVILASAARRMQLYILAYGLSVLRLMTLWGMIVIAVGILAAGWKLLRPGFRFFPVLFGFGLASWCLLCLMNPAGRVASYNVDAYLDGRLEEIDTWYLSELGPDARPAAERLAQSPGRARDEGEDALYWMDYYQAEPTHSWTNWKANK